jgi:hypothetical protein
MANASVGPFRERGFAGCMPLTGYVTLGCPVQRADSVHGPWPDTAVESESLFQCTTAALAPQPGPQDGTRVSKILSNKAIGGMGRECSDRFNSTTSQ